MTLRIRPASEVLAEQLAADPLKDFFKLVECRVRMTV